MPKSKARKNVDENFKVAAVQRLQTGDVPANDLAKELGVSIWSLRRWSRNIVREQRQERAQQANPPRLRPRLKSCRLSRAVNHQSSRQSSTAD
jgi:transposase-like protein